MWNRPGSPGWYIINNGRGWVPVYVEPMDGTGGMRIIDLEDEAPSYVDDTYAISWAGKIYLGEE